MVWAQRPDGRRIRFLWQQSSQRFVEDKPDPVAYLLRHADQSYVLHTEDRMVETYDRFGYVRTVMNRQGIGWTFTYQDNYLQAVTHTGGRSITFQWTQGRLTRVVDPAGAAFDYGYDINAFGAGLHRLASVTLPGPPATVVTHHYDSTSPAYPGALTGLSYDGVRYSTYQYDGFGRVWRSQNSFFINRYDLAYTMGSGGLVNPPPRPPPPGGVCNPNTNTCVHPQGVLAPGDTEQAALERLAVSEAAAARIAGQAQVLSVTEHTPLGRETVYQFQQGRRLIAATGLPSPNCPGYVAARTYDTNGNPDLVEDFEGHLTDYDYNASGRLERKVEGVGTGQARTTVYEWDTVNNRLDRMIVQGDREETYLWHPDHRPAGLTVRNLSSHGVPGQTRTTTVNFSLHGNGMVHQVTVDGPMPGPGDAVVSTYSAQGDLLEVRNSLGQATTYSQHNGRGQPGRVVGPNGEAVEYQYDQRGRVTRVRTFRNAGSQDTVYTYAASGLLASISHPDGVVEALEHDAARRLEAIVWNQGGDTLEQRWDLDAAGNPTRSTLRRNGAVQQESWTDYDELGRVRARRGNDGQHQRFEHDGNARLRFIRPTTGPATELRYDALGRLARQLDAAGSTVFAHDAGDRMRQITDPRGLVTRYEHDGFGQLWRLDSPDTGVTTQQWSAGGLRTSLTRADGVTETFGHDALGRPTSRTAGGVTHTWTWDSAPGCNHGLGRLCRVQDPHQTLVLGYTPYGELASQAATVAGTGYTHSFGYDGRGRLARIVYPGNIQADYTWSQGMMTRLAVTIGGQQRTVIDNLHWAFDATEGHHYHERTYGNGLRRRDYLDRDGRLYSIVSKLGQGLRYAFDDNDRITGITNFADGALSQGFTYDDLDRLTDVSSVGLGNQTFDYDNNGNRRSHTLAGASATYTISPTSNRLAQISGAQPRGFEYRASGELSQVNGSLPGGDRVFGNGFQVTPAPVYSFSYDPFNRLSGVSGPGVDAGYQVAATGLRVQKTVQGRSTRFVYSPAGQLLYEHAVQANRRSAHLYFQGQPVGLVRDGVLYFVLPDHLGRPELLSDSQGQIAWRARLRAFNRQVNLDRIGGYGLGFPGQYHDDETGLAYNVFRDYDPATGRYIQSDPIGLVGGINTYAYSESQPTSQTDPMGLRSGSSNAWNRFQQARRNDGLTNQQRASIYRQIQLQRFGHNSALREALENLPDMSWLMQEALGKIRCDAHGRCTVTVMNCTCSTQETYCEAGPTVGPPPEASQYCTCSEIIVPIRR